MCTRRRSCPLYSLKHLWGIPASASFNSFPHLRRNAVRLAKLKEYRRKWEEGWADLDRGRRKVKGSITSHVHLLTGHLVSLQELNHILMTCEEGKMNLQRLASAAGVQPCSWLLIPRNVQAEHPSPVPETKIKPTVAIPHKEVLLSPLWH